uniref:Solute carrier family 2, facilitated glucose transporter member 5 n=1 Tax=Leptobrachium leishanense TaxID=445787 RepID=A0A8C5P6S3_9ANUR
MGVEFHFSIYLLPTQKLFWAVTAVGIGGTFQYGYSLSVINAPTTYIQKFINSTWYDRHQSTLNEGMLTLIWSVIVSIFTLGGLLGTFIGGKMSVKLGRKKTLIMNNFLALFAAFFMGLAEPAGLFELLIVGRFFIGLNAGISICVQPLYLGEIAPKNIRGLVTVGINVFLTFGILAGQIVGLQEILGNEDSWPFLLSTCFIPALIQLVTLPAFPESPRYLLIQKKNEHECQKALKALYGPHFYQSEMEDIQKEAKALDGEKPKKTLELFRDRTIRWQLIIAIITNAGQQLCGINAGLLIDKAGRRVLIIGGYAVMAFWCIILTVTLTFQDTYSWIPYISMSAILAFILCFGLGPGGVTNTLTAELFTQSTRSGAYVIGGTVNWLSFFIIGITFPFIVNGLNQFCFLFFFVACSAIAAFIYFIVPETKNKSFLDIKAEFQKLNFGQFTSRAEEHDYKRGLEMRS